jgi:hypothetical protein
MLSNILRRFYCNKHFSSVRFLLECDFTINKLTKHMLVIHPEVMKLPIRITHFTSHSF